MQGNIPIEPLTEKDEHRPAINQIAYAAGTAAVWVAGAAVVIVTSPFIAAKYVADAAWDKLEKGLDKAEEKIEEALCNSETLDAVEDFVSAHKERFAAEPETSTGKLAKGFGKIAYGLTRGGLAITALVGHGPSAALLRQRNPVFKRAAAEIIKHGFEAARDEIQAGAKLLKQGITEQRKK